jgi:hypothetical protein
MMLDNYINGAHPTGQSNRTEQQNPPQWNVSWGDQVMNSQNMVLPMQWNHQQTGNPHLLIVPEDQEQEHTQ